MGDVLKDICNHRASSIELQKKQISLSEIKQKALAYQGFGGCFVKAIQDKVTKNKVALIAEIKKQSPSKGLIRENFDPSQIANHYKNAGAACLSVLTEEKYFAGHNDYLISAKKACNLPILRKDFIIDEYQIYESKLIGADCILLIAAALETNQLIEFENLAINLGLDVLVEVHNEEELKESLKLKTPLIGVNNRNLKTLEVSLDVAKNLSKLIPDNRIKVCESGIASNENILEMQNFGYQTFLVGESLMKQENIEKAVRDLLGNC
jgi:indole-3-glycerol phosphate synthase